MPLQAYQSSDAGKSIEAFLKLESAVTTKAFDPVTATALATLAVSIVDMLEKQNNKRVEEAIKVIEEQFSRARWTTFEPTTREWVDKKYHYAGPGK